MTLIIVYEYSSTSTSIGTTATIVPLSKKLGNEPSRNYKEKNDDQTHKFLLFLHSLLNWNKICLLKDGVLPCIDQSIVCVLNGRDNFL